jgi:hypothetical protein
MIDQSNITGRVTREHDVVTGKPIYLLFINDEFIKEYKTHAAAQGQLTKRLTKLVNQMYYQEFMRSNSKTVEV